MKISQNSPKTDGHLAKGDRVGHLKVLYRGRKGKSYFYHCKCDCGSYTDVDATALERREQTSCLCKGRYLEVGMTYGFLTVKERIKRGIYRCECDCGKKDVIVGTSEVLTGRIKSCGCSYQPYNRKVRKDSRTGIRGVTKRKKTGKYVVYIAVGGKNRYLGSFDERESAGKLRKEAETYLKENGNLDAFIKKVKG